jgi:hypothetical protein
LLCAHCAQPVADARCPVCRSARDRLHHSGGLTASTVWLVLALLLLVVAAVLHSTLSI